MSTIENENAKDLSVPYTELFNVVGLIIVCTKFNFYKLIYPLFVWLFIHFQIDTTLKETQERFNAMQEKILRRMDVMTEQLKDLEKKIDSAIEEQGPKADLPSWSLPF